MNNGEDKRDDVIFVDSEALAKGIIKVIEQIDVAARNFKLPEMLQPKEPEKPERPDIYRNNQLGMKNFLRHKK